MKVNYVWPTGLINNLKKQGTKFLGINQYQLMYRAGLESYKTIRKIWPNSKNWLILCGYSSDNGGIGYIVATLGLKLGLNIKLISFDKCKNSSKLVNLARKKWIKLGGVVYNKLDLIPSYIDVIIDALLGITINNIECKFYDEIIKRINLYTCIPVFSIDMPSGLSSSTGIVLRNAIKANHTISIGMLNPGQLTGQAKNYVGKLHYSDIGLGQFLIKNKSSMIRYDINHLKYWLKARQETSHKNHFGRLLIIGGTIGMAGAIRMTAEAALRTGSGIVKVITHKENVILVSVGRPELIIYKFTIKNLLNQLNWADIVVIGPGLGLDSWSYEVFKIVLKIKKPTLWDADALNMLALYPNKNINNNRVMTPHPGEAAKLLGISINEVEKNRILALKKLVKLYGGVIVLKGSGTIIANENGNIVFADAGNVSLASAGMGDILSGIIASLIGQKLSIFDAACAGCIIHGASGEYLSRKRGNRGILATDLLNIIWKFVNPEKIY